MENDEFFGMGGSYLIDQDTGRRTLIERTQETTTEIITETIEPVLISKKKPVINSEV